MSDLIARLEAATEGSRELDYKIALTQGWTLQKMKGDRKPYWREPGETQYYMRSTYGPPHYTTSLDDAMTLVPEGCDVDLQTRKRYCSIYRWDDSRGYGVPLGSTCDAETPVLALCIAALKAREATND